MSPIIHVQHLTKDFGEIRAVDDLSFSVGSGQVYGFLGQNGAGKSTTIRMLLTLVRPTAGKIEIFGMDLSRHRREILSRVGAIIERPDLYKYLTAEENLGIFARMSGRKLSRKQIHDQLEQVGLAQRAKSKVKTYSQGMKQRLGIAVALVHDPDLVILDEPTNGLDPQGIADVRNLILHLSRDRQKTMLISSHLLGEMELIADAMLIIDKGRKLVEGSVKELFDPAEMVVELSTVDIAGTAGKLERAGYRLTGTDADAVFFRIHREKIPGLVRELVEMDIPVLSLHPRHSLEDYFLSLTQTQKPQASKPQTPRL
jgi:ABC-type multidrug transport system ATPase subunit